MHGDATYPSANGEVIYSSSACISHYTLLHWICIAAAAVPPWFFLKFFPPRSPELFRNFWGALPQNHLTCLGALLLSESGFCRASLLFLSSSDLPTQGLTCLGALLLSESAANSLFFCRYPLDFFSIASLKKTMSWQLTRLGAALLSKSACMSASQSC